MRQLFAEDLQLFLKILGAETLELPRFLLLSTNKLYIMVNWTDLSCQICRLESYSFLHIYDIEKIKNRICEST